MRNLSASPVPPRKTLMIVEDQVLTRHMLVRFLSQEPDFEVVAEAETLREGVSLAVQHTPEVIILDWSLPDGDGAQFLAEMRANRLQGLVLVLSAEVSVETVRTALLEGARGFFEKTGDLNEFLVALRTVANGGAYLGPAASSMVQQLVERQRSAPEAPAEGVGSTPPIAFEPVPVASS